MSDEDWRAGFAKSLGVFLNGDAIPTPERARRARRRRELLRDVQRAPRSRSTFTLPEEKWGTRWTQVLNTYESAELLSDERAGPELPAATDLTVQAWSTVLLRRIN